MIISVAIATILQNDPRWAKEEGALSPLVFNPDRFMSVEGGKAGEQVPFGVGTRNCLGMPLALAEMKRHARCCSAQVETSSSSNNNEPIKCPMLSALRELPPGKVSAWESLSFAFESPTAFQEQALGGLPLAQGTYLAMPAVYIGDLGLAKDVVAGDGDFTQVGYPESTVTLLGRNSITMTADVERHRYLRRLMTPGMASEEMDAALPRLALRAERLFEGWALEGDAGRTVSALHGFKSFTFGIIMSIVFGEELPLPAAKTAELEEDFRILVQGLFIPPQLVINMWPFQYHRSMQARTKLLKFITSQITHTRGQLSTMPGNNGGSARQAGSRFGSLHGILLARDEAGGGLTDSEVADNVVTLLFAGHDTTSSSLTSALHQISMNPLVMGKMRAEQKEIVSTYGPSFTPEVMRRMQYTDAVTRETLRYRPIIANILRQAIKPFGLNQSLVQDGRVLLVALSNILLKDSRWAGHKGQLSPDSFNPDRFTSFEGSKAGDQVPFGIGSRNCLGMPLALAEMKIVLAVLARKYCYTADCNTDYKEFPIPEPRNGLPVYVTRLQEN
ncbi:MAG: hypothetical protein WDW38_011243 [Sanguina aurantia]